MAFRRTYGCSACGATWQFLHMTKGEPAQPCPNGCSKKPTQELSAPALNVGAPDRGIAIPQSQGARETLAADLALKGTGMANINSHMKPGDIAAKAIPTEPVPSNLRETVTPRFLDYQGGISQAATDPYKARNLSIIDGMRKR